MQKAGSTEQLICNLSALGAPNTTVWWKHSRSLFARSAPLTLDFYNMASLCSANLDIVQKLDLADAKHFTLWAKSNFFVLLLMPNSYMCI